MKTHNLTKKLPPNHQYLFIIKIHLAKCQNCDFGGLESLK